ncbi:type II secretion system protein [Luteolibacter algae]|uniref:Type II secretion system protein n=1 Tax=Luteolibacter algae TaxID=454151 RepID=A0ABW5D8P4_9BACT
MKNNDISIDSRIRKNILRQSVHSSGSHGFTLIELLVVVAMIIALAGIVFSVRGTIRDRAAGAVRLSNLRQSGMILLSDAAERNGRCTYFQGGSGNFELRPYYMVTGSLNLGSRDLDDFELMNWDRNQLPPSSAHWNCYAVNFNNVPEIGAEWIQTKVEDSGKRSANVKSLALANLIRPGVYPLLIDSSTSDGSEIFRIDEKSGNLVGLRNSGKANAFMFDGAARAMDRDDLKKAGFTKAYDNSSTPPKMINL